MREDGKKSYLSITKMLYLKSVKRGASGAISAHGEEKLEPTVTALPSFWSFDHGRLSLKNFTARSGRSFANYCPNKAAIFCLLSRRALPVKHWLAFDVPWAYGRPHHPRARPAPSFKLF